LASSQDTNSPLNQINSDFGIGIRKLPLLIIFSILPSGEKKANARNIGESKQKGVEKSTPKIPPEL
jgi:hypothetical protein